MESHSLTEDYKKSESDTEYHEIRNERFLEGSLFSPQTPTKLSKQFDFFTQFDVKSFQKLKKQRKCKKSEPTNLMDIINSELGLLQTPLTGNVVTKIDYPEEQTSYLFKTPIFQKVFQKKNAWRGDIENGWRHNGINLDPVFPRILENTTSKTNFISVQYVEPAMFVDILTEYQEYETKQSPKFLEITIRDVMFSHHHEFSLENLLCIKLLSCFEMFCNIQKQIHGTLKNTDINKKTRDNLKKQLLKIGSTTKEDLRYDETILKYTGMFLSLKDTYYELLNTEKELRHKILSLWADVEMIRQKLGTTNTPYIIELAKTVLDDNKYEKELTNAFEIEFLDMLDRLEYEYIIKYLEYKKFKQHHKPGHSEDKKILKPKLYIDEEKIKDEVENIVNKIVTKDQTNIILKQDKSIIQTSRSNQLAVHKYNFKIYVDNVFVCASESVTSPLLLNWIDFNDILSIEILPNNEILTIFLCEDELKIASVIINISEVRLNSPNANFHENNFICNNIVEPTAEFIGSGFDIKEIVTKIGARLKTSNMFKGKLYTTAKVNIKVGWNDKLINYSIQQSMYLGRQLKRFMHGKDKPHVGILKDIIEKIYDKNIDNDSNINLALQDACKETIHEDCTFTINENTHEMTRLKLLNLRHSGGFDDVIDKTIPIFPSQISTEQWFCLQKSEEGFFDLQLVQENSELDAIEVQRFMSNKYMEKLNAKLKKSICKNLLKKTYKDVVRDFRDLSLSGIFSHNSNFELETTSSVAKQQLLTECLSKEQEVNIVAVRAINLLDRSTAILSEEPQDDDSIAGFKVRPLRPFVRIRYRDVSAQTPTAIGCHPTWNSSMKMKTKLSPLSSIHVSIYDEYKIDISEAYSEEVHGSLGKAVHYRYYNKWLGSVQIPLFTVLSLGSFRGTFKITSPPVIFGYDALELKESKSVIPEVTQLMKKESSYLTLHISTNISHLGGFQGYTQPVPNSENDLKIKHLNTFVTDYLNEFPSRNISLTYIDSFGRNKCVTEFLQSVPLPNSESFPKNPKIMESALSKSSGISKSSSSRSSRKKLTIATTEQDRESESSAPENLWKGSESKGDPLLKLVDAVLRYVALIPTYEISECHVVTLSGAELLKVLCGSHFDHTILLASYYIHLGIKCWVVTGLALPRGVSSYVLVKYDQRNRIVMVNDPPKNRSFLARGDSKQFTWFVYDAVAGERFELREASCPLKTVNYVFDSENIWVNIQTSEDCESVSFDFSKSSNWKPVFEDPLFTIKLPPAPIDRLYSAAPDVELLRSNLETKVKNKVQKWRSHMKTVWNRYCGSLLREMLPHWEYWAFNPTEPRPVPGQRLKQLMITYKMFGFPLNVPYINAKNLISSVKSTGIHLNDDPDVEFGLAVEVYAYPNNVLSVWVFLTTITRI